MKRWHTIPLIILVLLTTVITSCKLPYGSSTENEDYTEDLAYVIGFIDKNEDNLSDISVGLMPLNYTFPTDLDNFLLFAKGLDVTDNGRYEIAVPKESEFDGYMLLTGLGKRGEDSLYVQKMELDITLTPLDIRSPHIIQSPFADTTVIDLSLQRKVDLYKPDSYDLWKSGEAIFFNPSVDITSQISWRYEDIVINPPNHTRFILVLWSESDGIIWYSPSTAEELSSQAPGETSITFPQDSFILTQMLSGNTYRFTVFAVQNVGSPSHLIGVSSEIFWDGVFIYGEEDEK